MKACSTRNSVQLGLQVMKIVMLFQPLGVCVGRGGCEGDRRSESCPERTSKCAGVWGDSFREGAISNGALCLESRKK